jgi:Ca2+-binding EF-hand superfamily protein
MAAYRPRGDRRVSRYAVVLIGLTWFAAFAGCGRDDAASSTTPSTPAIPAEPATPPPVDASEPDTPPPPETSSDDQAATEPGNRLEDRARIAVLTPGGPLLVDAWISIDGSPHSDIFAGLVQRVLKAGDTDGDGRSTWAEWAANRDFLQGDLANVQPGDERTVSMWVERYDENRDKLIQPDEAAAWLGRDSGTSVRPLVLRSRRSYLPIPSVNSRVWQLLDADRDGRLAGNEMAAAPAKLWSLDADDDRIITPPELASLRDLLDAAAAQAMTPAFDDDRHAAIHLEPPGDVDRLQYLLGDLYAPRQDLGPTSFPDLPGLFESLDANHDLWLERNELAKLLTVKPHLELSIAFNDFASFNLPRANLRLDEHAPEVVVATQPAPNRVLVSLGNTRLIVSAHDLAGGPGGQRGDLRVMVHDQCDALFEELDANADGRLGEREIATCSARLSAYDANDDGAIDRGELPNYMLVAFLRGEAPNEQSFYTPGSATPTASGPAPSWFVRADFNGDGDVSRREFLGSIEQFSRLDANRDGFISGQEALEVAADNP